ncbi:hypothetical protein WJX75_007098 [Coccomyxa subellipsoidea]|uniref:Uncharacterized protein n=1 Tax=Coccomyxa subellipsoidea TaxID=248742 RepID=A0ABR2YLA0_9CHLO
MKLLAIHEELKKAGLQLAPGWRCVGKQRSGGKGAGIWDIDFYPPNGFTPVSGQGQTSYRSMTGVLRAHGVEAKILSTPSPPQDTAPAQPSSPEQLRLQFVVPRKKRGCPARRTINANILHGKEPSPQNVTEKPPKQRGSSEEEEVDICSSPAGLPAASLLPSCPQSPSQQDAQPPADDPPEPWFPLQSSPRASQPASVSGIATPPGHPQMGRYWQ